MREIIRLTVTFLCMFVLMHTSFSQEIKASLQIDSAQIEIGEQVKAVLRIEVDTAVEVKFPSLNKFITDQLEIVEVSKIETRKNDSNKILSQTLTITSFDSGNHAIPVFEFILETRNESVDTVFSNAAFLAVKYPPVDTTADIMDVKAPLDTPFKNREIWSYLNYLLYGIIIIVGALIGYQYYKLNKPKPKLVMAAPPAPELPETIAIRSLEDLNRNKNWDTEDGLKDFYEEVSFILRKYIQGRFKMMALERTSNEILKDIKNRALDKELYNSLNQVLLLSDFVKYAKYRSSKEENVKSLENAFLFVNKTKGAQIKEQRNV